MFPKGCTLPAFVPPDFPLQAVSRVKKGVIQVNFIIITTIIINIATMRLTFVDLSEMFQQLLD